MGHESAVYKALSDPTRRSVLKHLGQGEMTAGELASKFELTAPTVSHHLGVLREAGLVRVRREATTLHYSLDTTVFQDLLAALMDLMPNNPGEKS
ncbi:MAG: winged helix-turn-helix transcriptional regulator [Armatimonadetes bacterium]|nr:winged helix-turn-helix transcriptional regulator [Armatimonadota bacterium]